MCAWLLWLKGSTRIVCPASVLSLFGPKRTSLPIRLSSHCARLARPHCRVSNSRAVTFLLMSCPTLPRAKYNDSSYESSCVRQRVASETEHERKESAGNLCAKHGVLWLWSGE